MASIISAGTTSGTSLNLSADTSGVLQLATNGTTTAVTIDTSQNVGIGTASPTQPLHISKPQGAALIQSTTSTNSVYLAFNNGGGTSYVGVDTSTGSIFSSGAYGMTLFNAANSATTFFTNATERMRINAGAPILCLAGGNTSATGTGIAFPATQSASSDANTLDDYEEGTFTPTAFGAGSAGTTTYTTQAGTYTKIGRQVTLTFAINYTALTGTGELRYGNFPFTSGAPEFIGAIMTNGLNWSGGTSIVLYVIPNSTNGVIFGSTDDSGWSPQQCVNESADVRCTITYFT